MAVRDDGTLYLALTVRMGAGSTMGIVAMRDTDGDGVADVTEYFAVNIPGTELRFHDGDLYLGSKTAVYRFNFAGDELVPTGEPKDSVRLRAVELMGRHYGLFTDRIEAMVPERSAEEIEIQLEEKLQQFLLPEAG